MYGGAHLFRADTAKRLGETALRSLDEFAPDFVTFAKVLALPGADRLPESSESAAAIAKSIESDPEAARKENQPAWFAFTIYRRVREKLKREPVEDFRIDFEDGYGNRPDAEEDGHAAAAAAEVASGLNAGKLPPFIGIRVKPFTEELRDRGIHTMDIFLTELATKTRGELPRNFFLTLPKVTLPDEVAALAELCARFEPMLNLEPGALRFELMIETTQSVFNGRGEVNLLPLVTAGQGRCIAAHFGTYDYTAGRNITAAYQHMTHPACDFAREVMQVALAGTGIWLSDGATNILPVAPHRAATNGAPLTSRQLAEHRAAVHSAWKLHFDDIQHSLVNGYYQGWDLHPAQLPTRYAAVYSFFLSGLDSAAQQFHREGRSSDARRRGIRRRGYRARPAELLPAGDQLWRDHSGRSAVSYEPHTGGAAQRVVREDSRWPQEIGASIIPCGESLRSTREVHRLAEKLHRDCPSRKAQDSPE